MSIIPIINDLMFLKTTNKNHQKVRKTDSVSTDLFEKPETKTHTGGKSTLAQKDYITHRSRENNFTEIIDSVEISPAPDANYSDKINPNSIYVASAGMISPDKTVYTDSVPSSESSTGEKDILTLPIISFGILMLIFGIILAKSSTVAGTVCAVIGVAAVGYGLCRFIK